MPSNKEKLLQLCRQEIERHNSQLTKANTDLDSFQAKNKDMSLNMNKLHEDQWRKAAKAVASVFVGGADVCSKTTELEPLVLFYSNRAAKRMSLGKIRKAIDDCRIATRLDPGFLKVYLTTGNCHLVLGEIVDAQKSYKKYLDSGMVCLDGRLTIEASNGLKKAEKVFRYINQSAELLKNKTVDSATNALEVITKALSISNYSEELLEMKGEALIMLHKYEEAVEMCLQTLVFAEKNCNHVSEEDQKQALKLWRWSLMSRSYFLMDKFDLALSILEQYEQLGPPETKTEGPFSPSLASLHELLRYRSAGNEAFKGGKYREAVEHYTNVIKRSVESRHLTAICLCNRAASHEALGEVIDAISDCNLAIALDGDYTKALYRRASLYEKIRDYIYAADDLNRLVSLLENHSEKKYVQDLTLARRRLSSVNWNLVEGKPMDGYLILGLKGSESDSEIRKAYHKAILKHHPDKAGELLTRGASGADDHLWKETFTSIHEDAEKLFEIIEIAYDKLTAGR